MPRTRPHRGKLAKKPNAKEVVTKVDPKLEGAWKKIEQRIHDAQGRGAEAFDELWEAVGAAVHHDPPLYVLGGYKCRRRREAEEEGQALSDMAAKKRSKDEGHVLANPPFNDSDWGGQRLREDQRWKYGAPPAGNANFAWVQHFLHHLTPTGIAGFVLANGSMSSQQSGEGDIRKAIIEADLVDCMVAMPGQLFYSTQIPVCLWFLSRDKKNGLGARGSKMRNRSGETLFIDARKLGTMIDRVHRELTDADVARITATYHRWRGDDRVKYEDVAGFCKSVKTEEIRAHQHVLTPGRYVGAEDVEEDDENGGLARRARVRRRRSTRRRDG